jgi:hypothetical protein
MQPTDIPLLSAFSLITAEKLRNTGFKVEVQAMDWSTLTSRRAKRDPVADGGWNMFHTWWIGADVIDPMAIAFSGNPDKGWFGWPTDPKTWKLRARPMPVPSRLKKRRPLVKRCRSGCGQSVHPVSLASSSCRWLTGTT